MRRFVVALCLGIGAWLSGPAFAADRTYEPLAVYAVQVAADMDLAQAVLPPDVQTETMVALSTAVSERAALASRCCGKASAPVSADRTAIAFVQSFRHRHPDAGRGGLAAHLVSHPNNDGRRC